jgi:hypothetical protein
MRAPPELVHRRVADHHRVGETRVELCLGQPLGVRPEVEEVQRVV